MQEKWAYFMPELVVRPQKIKVFGRPVGGVTHELIVAFPSVDFANYGKAVA